MIRPITCICFILAGVSGLYLYQSKHRVQLLDRQIEDTIRATEQLREQTRVLHAEWTLRNDPQRLQALADQFLSLKPVLPSQFTSLADLDNRLPPIASPSAAPPDVAVPALVPLAQVAEPPPPEPPRMPAIVAAAKPAPPTLPPPVQKPVTIASAPVLSRPPEHKPPPPPPAPARASLAEVQPPVHASRPQIASVAPRPPAPEATPAFAGSALGMAQGVAVPPPRPMPVSASQWVTSGNGGG